MFTHTLSGIDVSFWPLSLIKHSCNTACVLNTQQVGYVHITSLVYDYMYYDYYHYRFATTLPDLYSHL